MRVEIEKPRPVCPAGLHTVTLVDVELKQQPDFNDPTKLVDRWIWQFDSDKRDADGDPYRIAVWTGLRYGNSQAKLTWLLDLLVPGLTAKEAALIETDDLLGTRYEASIKHEPKPKDPDTKVAVFAYLRPVPSEEQKADPFFFDEAGEVQVCAECRNELTDAEARNSRKHWGDTLLCTAHGRARLQAERAAAADPVAA